MPAPSGQHSGPPPAHILVVRLRTHGHRFEIPVYAALYNTWKTEGKVPAEAIATALVAPGQVVSSRANARRQRGHKKGSRRRAAGDDSDSGEGDDESGTIDGVWAMLADKRNVYANAFKRQVATHAAQLEAFGVTADDDLAAVASAILRRGSVVETDTARRGARSELEGQRRAVMERLGSGRMFLNRYSGENPDAADVRAWFAGGSRGSGGTTTTTTSLAADLFDDDFIDVVLSGGGAGCGGSSATGEMSPAASVRRLVDHLVRLSAVPTWLIAAAAAREAIASGAAPPECLRAAVAIELELEIAPVAASSSTEENGGDAPLLTKTVDRVLTFAATVLEGLLTGPIDEDVGTANRLRARIRGPPADGAPADDEGTATAAAAIVADEAATTSAADPSDAVGGSGGQHHHHPRRLFIVDAAFAAAALGAGGEPPADEIERLLDEVVLVGGGRTSPPAPATAATTAVATTTTASSQPTTTVAGAVVKKMRFVGPALTLNVLDDAPALEAFTNKKFSAEDALTLLPAATNASASYSLSRQTPAAAAAAAVAPEAGKTTGADDRRATAAPLKMSREEQLGQQTLAQLQRQCKAHGLNPSGRKTALVERLLALSVPEGRAKGSDESD